MATARNLTRETLLASELETAGSLWQKFLGLMGRARLESGAGLWFPGTNNIHMLFMRFPIDCVFLGGPEAEGRRVVALRRSLRPWTGVVWYARGARGVIELPAGTIDATSTQLGDRVSLDVA